MYNKSHEFVSIICCHTCDIRCNFLSRFATQHFLLLSSDRNSAVVSIALRDSVWRFNIASNVIKITLDYKSLLSVTQILLYTYTSCDILIVGMAPWKQFTYLITFGCYHLKSTPLVKLRISCDDGDITGSNFVTRFPVYISVMLQYNVL